MSSAAIQGDYVDLRFVKGRKVCQVVIEIPIEAGEKFVAAFGTPNPASGVPVALARITTNARAERKGGKLAQRAGILCNERSFQMFMEAHDADEAAEAVRKLCGIGSRADLDHDENAATRFLTLESRYIATLRGAA